jgi:hypothetical protein
MWGLAGHGEISGFYCEETGTYYRILSVIESLHVLPSLFSFSIVCICVATCMFS